MSYVINLSQGEHKRFDSQRFLAGRSCGVIVVAATLVQLLLGGMNCNVSWFITFAEKVLNGARPYIDVSDPNPPAAFVVYIPAVLLERLTGLRSEAFVFVEIVCALVASLTAVFILVRPFSSLTSLQWGQLLNCSLFFLLFAPSLCFGEREHFAVIGALPLMAVYWLRAAGHIVRPGAAAMAGVFAGLMLAFKPHFGFAFLFASVAASLLSKNYKTLLKIENLAIAGTFIVDLALIAGFFPEYYEFGLKPAVELYAAAHELAFSALRIVSFMVYGLIAVVFMTCMRQATKGAFILAAASLGFLLGFIIQGKLWIYQAYPAIIFIAGSCALIFVQKFSELKLNSKLQILGRLGPVFLAPPFCFGLSANVTMSEPFPGLTAGVRALAPHQPKIAALQEAMSPAFPLVRNLQGQWIGKQNSLWRTTCADIIEATKEISPEQRLRLDQARRTDLTEWLKGVKKGAPDILLIENAEVRRRYEVFDEVAKIMQNFRYVGVFSTVEVWVRKR